MDSEAQTPAVARLERAIESLEAALSDRLRNNADAASDSSASDNTAQLDDLARRHEALKSAVAACIGDIDNVLADEGRQNA